MQRPDKFPDDSLDVLDSLYTDIQVEPAARDIVDYARTEMSNGLVDYSTAKQLVDKLDELWKAQQLQAARVVVTGRSRAIGYPSEWDFVEDRETISKGFEAVAVEGNKEKEDIAAEDKLFTVALIFFEDPSDVDSAFIMDIDHLVKFEYSEGRMSVRKAEAILHTFAPEILLMLEKVVHQSMCESAEAIKDLLKIPIEFGDSRCDPEELVTAVETYLENNLTIDREAHYVLSANDCTGYVASDIGGQLHVTSSEIKECELLEITNEWLVIDRIIYVPEIAQASASETLRYPWVSMKKITPEQNGPVSAIILPGSAVTELSLARQAFATRLLMNKNQEDS